MNISRLSERRSGPAVAAFASVAAPAAVSLLAIGEEHLPTTAVALLFVLGVVVSTSLGGQLAGIVTALLSFLSLNFFFTPPLHTFAVASATEVIALVVFLAVSLGIGAFLSTSIEDRKRAERRELQLRVMNRLMTSLLSGEQVQVVLSRYGDEINDMLGAARCEISTRSGDRIDLRTDASSPSSRPYSIELRAKDRIVGQMSVWPSRSVAPAVHEIQVIEAFGKQLALALEGVRLSDEVRRTEMESEAHRVKATLFSGVTHDVKTPLAAITASVTSLLEGEGFTVAQIRDHLEMIQDESERLHRVVNNLLDLGRLRAGAHLPIKELTAIDELIESVVARMRALLRGREVLMRVAEDLPEVSLDVVQIDRVLTNLIENAMKFSPSNTPIVVSAIGSATNVRVTVTDSGPGVPKDDERTIFEPFQKGATEGSGTGLGLAIARAIVSAHGGSIWVGRAPSGGASFTFELPCGADREVTDQPAGTGR